MTSAHASLVDELCDGDTRALARAITHIEDRAPGYRDLVAELHRRGTGADVVGVTGSPGSGKSTLVDRLTATYREAGETVGVLAIDPSSPFSGGAVLGDRIRMGSAVGDDGVFVRSMSARGRLGGLSSATADAVKALDAAGMDRIIIETVGAGQNEVDIVRTADTVLVLVPPQSGDTVQMLKAGILEIADIFVVNKADLPGADRIVEELTELIRLDPAVDEGEGWEVPIVETVAAEGRGVGDLRGAIADHRRHLTDSGEGEARRRRRYAEELRTIVREELAGLATAEFEARGGLDELAATIAARETDPYAVSEEVIAPIRDCVDGR
ncbi:MAG: methylmalonyl Co-A mutase-associated GTPase MeaB [Halobacteriota archaeon]